MRARKRLCGRREQLEEKVIKVNIVQRVDEALMISALFTLYTFNSALFK